MCLKKFDTLTQGKIRGILNRTQVSKSSNNNGFTKDLAAVYSFKTHHLKNILVIIRLSTNEVKPLNRRAFSPLIICYHKYIFLLL